MKKLIICRHGEIQDARHLSLAGEEQIRALAELLRPHVQTGESVRLLTSWAVRAIRSSAILVHALGIKDFLRADELWSGDGPAPHDARRSLQFILDEGTADIVVVMTHFELCEELPPLFGSEVLGTPIATVTLERGQARIIDCVAKTATVVGERR